MYESIHSATGDTKYRRYSIPPVFFNTGIAFFGYLVSPVPECIVLCMSVGDNEVFILIFICVH